MHSICLGVPSGSKMWHSHRVDGYNKKNKMNFTTTMNFKGHINGLTNYSMWNMWIRDCNIGLWISLLLGVQRNFISDYGSRYPDAMSIGDSMSFAYFFLFLMAVHENEMTVHEIEAK